MEAQKMFAVIGDCADDLLGGGNACTVKDAATALEILDEMTFAVKLYIKQCCTPYQIIAEHNADKTMLKRVCKFAYDSYKQLEETK